MSDIVRVFITGPTASGKTGTALELARMWNCPVISADSRQCYKFLDIGTDKPARHILAEIPHLNISLLDPSEEDSSRLFAGRVAEWEQEMHGRNHPVLIAGGSTMYLQDLIFPVDPVPVRNDENMRLLKEEEGRDGLESLYKRLASVDPVYSGAMDGLNRQRIFRALDVWMQTGKPFSSFHTNREPKPGYDRFVFGLDLPRDVLYKKINDRVDLMIKNGLVDEVRNLLKMGYDPTVQSLQTVGYREVIRYLNRECSRDEMIADIKTSTRRYAKRQLTWFRRWPFIRWIDSLNNKPAEIAELIADAIRRVAAEEKSR